MMENDTTMMDQRPLHIVQLSSDDKVFEPGGSSESLRRQLSYGIALESRCPGSRMTLIIITKKKGLRAFDVKNVAFLPFQRKRRGPAKCLDWYHLYGLFAEVDNRLKVDVLTTQSVHDEAWVALWFARRWGIPIVGQIHFDIFNQHARNMLSSGLVGRTRYWTLLVGLRYFSALRVVGEGIAREIHRRGLHSHVHVSPVTMGMLATGSTPVRTDERKRILFVGRLAPQKNLFVWLQVVEKVCREVPEVICEIVGDGELRPTLEEAVRRAGLEDRIRFRGHIPYDLLGEIYRSASVFLITSNFEGFGRVVAEALSYQVPVVTSKIVGIEDIVVPGKSGFLHPPSDVPAMADSVIRLLRDPDLADSMGRWGEHDVKQRFDPAVLTNRWIQILAKYAR